MIKRILCFAALTLAAAFTSAAFAQSPPGNQVVATSHAGVAAVDVGILTAADKETNTMPTMRAKLQVTSVTRHSGCEVLKMNAVCKSSGYPADGSDEDNTYAKFSPQGELSLTVANPALHGKFNPGDKFYVDFTPADPPPQA